MTLNPTVQRLLEIRRDLALSSVSKYETFFQATTDADPFLRGCFQFYGAQRTGRFAGRLIQPHNLPSRGIEWRANVLRFLRQWIKDERLDLIALTFGSLSEGLKTAIRPTITAPKGFKFIVADLSSIEAVKTGWLSKCEVMLDIFRADRDIYKVFASHMYRIDYDDVTKEQRTEAKPPVLGCGFGLGAGKEKRTEWDDHSKQHVERPAEGLIKYAEDYGVDLSFERSKELVDFYRQEFKDVCKFWNRLDSTFKFILKHRDSGTAEVNSIQIFYRKPAAHLVLPSGRHLIYMQPAVQPKRTPWGKIKPTVTYMNYDGVLRSWYRHKTHGGKLTENVVQASARDYLTHGMLLAEQEGYTVIGHVHDELITMVPVNDNSLTVAGLESCMAKNPKWCIGSPVKAQGWEGDFYRKD